MPSIAAQDLVLESADSHSGGARQLQNGPRLLEALPAVSAALGRQLARDLSRKRTETRPGRQLAGEGEGWRLWFSRSPS